MRARPVRGQGGPSCLAPEGAVASTAPQGRDLLTIATPWGTIRLCWRGQSLVEVELSPFLEDAPDAAPTLCLPSHEEGRQLVADLLAYFQGEPVEFTFSLPDGAGTDFQRRVWAALTQIPRGRCSTYGALARRLGLPAGSARAVGLACAANPLPILVPCHRVVSATGQLTGYAAGLEWKRALLELEGVPLCNDCVLQFSLL